VHRIEHTVNGTFAVCRAKGPRQSLCRGPDRGTRQSGPSLPGPLRPFAVGRIGAHGKGSTLCRGPDRVAHGKRGNTPLSHFGRPFRHTPLSSCPRPTRRHPAPPLATSAAAPAAAARYAPVAAPLATRRRAPLRPPRRHAAPPLRGPRSLAAPSPPPRSRPQCRRPSHAPARA